MGDANTLRRAFMTSKVRLQWLRSIEAERALEDLLRLVPDEHPEDARERGDVLTPLVRRLAARTAETERIRRRRAEETFNQLMQAGLMALFTAATKDHGEGAEYLQRVVDATAANLAMQPRDRLPGEALAESAHAGLLAVALQDLLGGASA